MLKSFLLSIIFATVALPVTATEAVNAFSGLQGLVGTWRLAAPKTDEDRAFRLTYKLISKNTALVEVYGNPNGEVTETLYHADGSSLMATHYCGRGNQPRLKATALNSGNELIFEFFDITNLVDPNDPHMVRMRYTFTGKDHFQKEEVYRVKGKEYGSIMSLIRE